MSTHEASPISLRAHFDGSVIRLDEPYELPRDVPLLVTVLPSGQADNGITGWTDLSIEGLARAYGDDEPEYTDADLQP